MIIPLNKHVLIEPIVADSFIASQKETYEEIGVVLAVASDLAVFMQQAKHVFPVNKGDTVYFDSWLAAKYSIAGTDKYHWLVPFENIRAYEQVPE